MEKKAVFFIIFVAIMVSLSIYSVILKYDYDETKTPEQSTGLNQPDSRAYVERSALLKSSSFHIPENPNSEEASSEQIPGEISSLITGAVIKSSDKISYNDQKGYKLDYEMGYPVRDSYLGQMASLKKIPDWKIVQGVRSDSFAFIELENNQYFTRVSFFKLDYGTRIIVEAIEKSV